MNARQKAKKYKRMYESLLKQPVRFKVEQHKIDTLKFERFYPEALIVQENSSYLREVIVKDIAQGLASSLNKYIDYYTEFCPHINKYRLCGEIKVVDRL
jgi:hypothetical protein